MSLAVQVTPAKVANSVLSVVPGSGGQGPAVFDDWTAMYARLQELRAQDAGEGYYDIIVDDNVTPGAITLPVAAFDMTNCRLLGSIQGGRQGSSQTIVQIMEGTTLPGLRHVERNISLHNQATATAPIPDYGAQGDAFFIGQNAQLLTLSTAPFIDAAANANGPLQTIFDVSGFGTLLFGEVLRTAASGQGIVMRMGPNVTPFAGWVTGNSFTIIGDNNYVNAKHYGAGQGGDDTLALGLAVAAAVQENRSLYLPQADYNLGVPTEGESLFTVSGHLTIFGDGRGLTTISMPDAGDVTAYQLFEVVGADASLTVKNLKIDLERSQGALETEQRMFNYPGEVSGSRFLLLEDCELVGSKGAYSSSGSAGQAAPVTVTANRCKFDMTRECVQLFLNIGATEAKNLRLNFCQFVNGYDGHYVYTHPGCDWKIDNCDFIGAGSASGTSYLLQITGGTVPGDLGSSVHITNCLLDTQNTCRLFALHDVEESRQPLLITNCDFRSGGGESGWIDDFFRAQLTNCSFTAAYNVVTTNVTALTVTGSQGDAILTNCSFYADTPADVSWVQDQAGSNVSFSLTNCSVIHKDSRGTFLTTVSAKEVNFDNFIHKYEDTASNTGCTLYTHNGGNTRISMRGVKSYGPLSRGNGNGFIRLNAIGAPDQNILMMSDSQFYDNKGFVSPSVSGNVVNVDSADWDGKVFVFNSRVINSGTNGFNFVAAGAYLNWEPAKGVDSVASAAEAVINSNSDFWKVSGTATVDDINWWNSGGASNPTFAGEVSFQATDVAGFDFSDTGNITLDASPRHVNQGEVVKLRYVPQDSSWYEVK